jgi:hypothetical protein
VRRFLLTLSPHGAFCSHFHCVGSFTIRIMLHVSCGEKKTLFMQTFLFVLIRFRRAQSREKGGRSHNGTSICPPKLCRDGENRLALCVKGAGIVSVPFTFSVFLLMYLYRPGRCM